MVPLYLTVPIIFDSETKENIRYVALNKSIPEEYIYETITRLLESASVTNNRVFHSYPVDTSLYKAAYQQIINKTIERFGLIEWKAISMTNEIHGHTGIYSIMRHPQYSAFFLWAIGAMLLFQNWVVVLLGLPVIVLTYLDMIREDKRNIEKFGKPYEEYMKKVPRANFVVGIVRLITKRG